MTGPSSSLGVGIGPAVEALLSGRRVRRSGWNGKKAWLGLIEPSATSEMTLPYVFMRTEQGEVVPWLCSQTDLLATDWEVI